MNYRPLWRTLALACIAIVASGCADDVARNERGMADFHKGDCKAAFAEWSPLAKRGLAAAENNLGAIYERGCPAAGIPQDFGQALHWYLLAAYNDFPIAMYAAGVYHQRGLGVAKDEDIAKQWYVVAARWGEKRAQYQLEVMGVSVPPADLYDKAVAEREKAQAVQAGRAAKRQEFFDDAVAVVLGAALGVAASHDQAPTPSIYAGAFSGSQSHTTPATQSTTAPTSYHGTFTGTQSSNAPAAQTPTITSGLLYTGSTTTSFRTIGNTTYITRADGATVGIVETIGNTKSGHDPNTGRTWTETKIGNAWSGQDSNGKTWTVRQVGDSTVTTYSDGTTKTCRVVGDQLSCS